MNDRDRKNITDLLIAVAIDDKEAITEQSLLLFKWHARIEAMLSETVIESLLGIGGLNEAHDEEPGAAHPLTEIAQPMPDSKDAALMI